jgi:DNA polymerase alpha subunit A
VHHYHIIALTHLQQLSKDPSAYPNGKSMPSVQVALRLIAKGKPVRAKDVMSFIITGDASNSAEAAASNAFPPEDVLKTDSGLKPDVDYYLHKQILPPVERLCAPISLTNITRLAECLGLDTSKYRVSGASNRNTGGSTEELIQPLDSQTPDHIRFASCSPLKFRCRNKTCQKFITFRSVAESMAAAASNVAKEANTNALVTHQGLACPGCETGLPNLTVVMQMEHQIRSLLSKYYEGWLVCDDPSCGNRTRQMSVYGHRCLGPRGQGKGCLGKMNWEMGEKGVWNQLVFWEKAFDVEKAKVSASVKMEGDVKDKMVVLAEVNRERFGTCRGVVKAYLDKSGRQWVDMGTLFGFVKA